MLLCSSGEHSQKGWVTTLEVLRGIEGGRVQGPQVTSSVIRVALCLWDCQASSTLLINVAKGCHKDP